LVDLYKSNKQKTLLSHRLIAGAFLEKVSIDDVVNHKDGNKMNNKIENLEWCTRSYNTRHAYDLGTNKRGELSVKSKLKEVEVLDIYKKSHEGYLTQKEIANIYNISRESVSAIKRGLSWSHLTSNKKSIEGAN